MAMRARELLAAGTEATTEAAFRNGDYDSAKKILEGALEQARMDGDRSTEAAALHQLGMLMHFHTLDRDLEGAAPEAEESLFRSALAIRREIGDMAGMAESLFGIGIVQQVLRHDWTAAMPYFGDAMALADAHGNALTRSECHRHVGFYYVAETTEAEEGLRHLRTSLDLRHEWGDVRWVPSGTFAVAMAELVLGRRTNGIAQLRQAIQQSRAARLSEKRTQAIEKWLRRAEAGETPSSR
jgi:hypothetical protein